MTWRHLAFILALPACLLLAVRFSPSIPPDHSSISLFNWSLADVRILDPVDAAIPSLDLLAVYLHSAGDELYLRLDLLDHTRLPDFDVYIALDTVPGGRRDLPIEAQTGLDWDLLLVIPANGQLAVLGPDTRTVPAAGFTVLRNPALDTLTIALSGVNRQTALPGLQVLIAAAGSRQISDQSEPVSSGPIAIQPARLLLAFDNSFPAYTPATALRRWHGAHTGPLGGSHGLEILLQAARDYQIPLALLDLKRPESLSALETVNGLPLVQEMASAGLLILPEPVDDLPAEPGIPEPAAEEVAQGREIASRFGLTTGGMLSTPPGFAYGQLPARLIFSHIPPPTQNCNCGERGGENRAALEPIRLLRAGSERRLPLPASADPYQATPDGPSDAVRRAIVAAALEANRPGGEGTLLVLGGNLPDSAWGAAEPARAAFRYLRSRPWISFLTTADLQAMPSATLNLTQETTADPAHDSTIGSPVSAAQILSTSIRPAISDDENQRLLSALSGAPENALKPDAWQAYWSLYAPVYPAAAQLPELRAQYSRVVWSLLEAGKWAEHPAAQASCDIDSDHDGRPECVLSNPTWYAEFDADSGALTHLFYLDAAGVHQWVAPSAQVITGLSDAGAWDPGAGMLADPAVLPGAFYETGLRYQAQIEADRLIFTAVKPQVEKIFSLSEDGLQAEYRSAAAFPFANIQAAVAPDPWQRFTPGWSHGYPWIQDDSSVSIAVPGAAGFAIHLQSSAPLTVQGFSDSLQLLSRAENPDRDYPPGHYLPFPFFHIMVSTQGQSRVMITITRYL